MEYQPILPEIDVVLKSVHLTQRTFPEIESGEVATVSPNAPAKETAPASVAAAPALPVVSPQSPGQPPRR